MAPFLRDTLIGLNYAHYAPPGAQVLYTNPLFVRSHDFVGLQGTNGTWKRNRSTRERLAQQRGWKAGWIAHQFALCFGGGRAKFLDSLARAGLDLGRPGSAAPAYRDDSALVERHARAIALGGAAHGLRRDVIGGVGIERRPPQSVLDALGQYAMPARSRSDSGTAGAGPRQCGAGHGDAVGAVRDCARLWRAHRTIPLRPRSAGKPP